MMTRRWMSFASIVAVVMGVFSRPATAVDYVKIPQDPTGGGYQAFPDITRLQDGRLMCVFYNGYQHVSPPNAQWPNGGRIDYSISTQRGVHVEHAPGAVRWPLRRPRSVDHAVAQRATDPQFL